MTLDPSVVSLARSIVSDLRAAGVNADLELADKIRLRIPKNAHIDDARVSEVQQRLAHELLQDGDRGPAIRELLPGDHVVDTGRISPVLRIAESGLERSTFEYCRLSQTVPSGRRIGRQIRALVFDVGQSHGPRLMGAFGLASPLYAVGCRDTFLNWSGRDARSRKNAGLRRLMDLHLCTSLPPYNSLFGGKLLAALAVSREVLEEFQGKYDDALLGVSTSCATGAHCAAFNRIMLHEGGLYRRVGMTAGYTISWMRPDTFRLARRVADGSNAVTPHSILDFDLKPLVIVRRALKVIGVPFDSILRLGQQKGVYFAQSFPGAAELLRTGERSQRRRFSFGADEAIAYWKDKLLVRKLQLGAVSDQDVA